MITKIIQSINLLFHRKKKFYGLFFYQLGFIPQNINLYKCAFTHRSASHSNKHGYVNYERLEYLGDAVLGAVFAEVTYLKFPLADEGFMTRVRSQIVNRQSLNELSLKLGFNRYVISAINLDGNKHIFGDIFEAFIGAVYLDRGYEKARNFIINFIIPNFFDIENIASTNDDYKSNVIQWAQKNKKEINFETQTIEPGQQFECKLLIENQIFGHGTGTTKKEAEQHAANEFLFSIEKQNIPEQAV